MYYSVSIMFEFSSRVYHQVWYVLSSFQDYKAQQIQRMILTVLTLTPLDLW